MRTVTARAVFEEIVRRKKMDPATAQLDGAMRGSIMDAMSRRLEEAWKFAWWPELMLLEERFFRADWNIATPYVAGDIVYSPTEDAYYECILANTGQAVTDTTYWTPPDDWDRYVAWEQAGQTRIGTALQPAFSANPRTTANYTEHRFALSENGMQFGGETGTSVWIVFRRQASRLASDEWVDGKDYSAGELVYYTPTGECYECLTATSAENPENALFWMKQEIPLIFRQFLVSTGYAETLRDEGNDQRADAEDERAQAVLEMIYDREIVATGQQGRAAVRAY